MVIYTWSTWSAKPPTRRPSTDGRSRMKRSSMFLLGTAGLCAAGAASAAARGAVASPGDPAPAIRRTWLGSAVGGPGAARGHLLHHCASCWPFRAAERGLLPAGPSTRASGSASCWSPPCQRDARGDRLRPHLVFARTAGMAERNSWNWFPWTPGFEGGSGGPATGPALSSSRGRGVRRGGGGVPRRLRAGTALRPGRPHM